MTTRRVEVALGIDAVIGALPRNGTPDDIDDARRGGTAAARRKDVRLSAVVILVARRRKCLEQHGRKGAKIMKIEGRCYCGEIRYRAEGEPVMKVQCHCRECQYISGGSPNVTLGMREAGFAYTHGAPKIFRRSDLTTPVTREFCGNCAPGVPGAVLLKVGTFDDPSLFGGAQMAIYTCDKQPFHSVPDGIPVFERVPGA
jgi:hypothetical protein